jgi:NodT family efflux transporter outer membrane factor (OMF) lipoprotein
MCVTPVAAPPAGERGMIPSRPVARRRHRLAVSAAALAGLWLAGCAAVGPNFTRPAVPAADSYAAAGDAPTTLAVLTSDARGAGPWWRALGSKRLDAVMSLALAHNQTVAAVQAALEKAQAQAEEAGAARVPSLTASTAYQRERVDTAALGFPGFPSPTFNFYSIGPSVSYDLDVAGGVRRGVEVARAKVDVESARADAAYLALTGNVALEAIRIAAANARIAAAEAVIADDEKAVAMLRKAEAAGGESASARLSGDMQRQQDRALLPPLRQELAQARHALALLVGEPPSQWTAPDFAIDEFASPPLIPVALPSILVRRRPDIRAAEAQLHADTAQIGVDTAKLYPDVRLAGVFSQEGVAPSSVFSTSGMAYNFGPTLSLPILDGGALRAERRADVAQARASLASYRQTVITAFGQVSDVLSALGQDQERLANLEAAEAVARDSLDRVAKAHDLGGVSQADLTAADRHWRQASLSRADAAGQRLSDIVALYGATAADWRAVSDAPPRK